MADGSALFAIPAFGIALWLGLYLLAGRPEKPAPRLTGLGLVAYALALAADLLGAHLPPAGLGLGLAHVAWLLLVLPPLLWLGALLHLLPETLERRGRGVRLWTYGLLPFTLIGALLVAVTSWQAAIPAAPPDASPGYLGVATIVLASLGIGLGYVVRMITAIRPARAAGLLLVASLFFGLSAGLLLLPVAWWPRAWTLVAIGVDLTLLGLAIAAVNAFDEGESLLPDLARSLVASGGTALLFGLPVALVMLGGTGTTAPMVGLLLTTVAAAVALPVLADPLQATLDRFVLARWPQLRQERAELRAAASALPRVDPDLDPTSLDEAEFARLTRRALSHYGDLARLASSPLTRLPLVEARLARRGVAPDTLARAAELKALLAECIAALKPADGGDFGASDEWRYYNVLYFPYIAGLKPSSLRLTHEQLDPVARAALEWFRTSVPERTLHNWQTTAARLVARQLRERQPADDGGPSPPAASTPDRSSRPRSSR